MPQAESSSSTMVVGIGASAGGLEALKQRFAATPGDTGLAFLVVVHLSPEHPGHLADLLQPARRSHPDRPARLVGRVPLPLAEETGSGEGERARE